MLVQAGKIMQALNDIETWYLSLYSAVFVLLLHIFFL